MSNTSQNERKRKRRSICERCKRPTPQACICAALPTTSPLTLSKSRVLVLQHPQEAKRKNRSLPLVEMCFSSDTSDSSVGQDPRVSDVSSLEDDFMFHTVVGRRFGPQTNKNIMRILQDPTERTLLIYPSEDAICLEDALEQVKRNQIKSRTIMKESSNDPARITLVFLDATWKYAKEMENACTTHNVWPSNLIRVKLSPANTNGTTHDFQPRRFDIRTPPSPNHLSTAECIARVLAIVEDDVSIFDTLMKPLDLMVQQWHSFSKSKAEGKDEFSVNASIVQKEARMTRKETT